MTVVKEKRRKKDEINPQGSSRLTRSSRPLSFGVFAPAAGVELTEQILGVRLEGGILPTTTYATCAPA